LDYKKGKGKVKGNDKGKAEGSNGLQQYRQPDETSTDDKKNGEYQWQNYSYSNDWGDEGSSPGACGSTDDPVAIAHQLTIALQEPGRPQMMNDQQIHEIMKQQYAIHAAMKAQTDLEQRKIVQQIYEDMNSLKQMHMQTQAAPPAAINLSAEIEAEATIDLTHNDDLGTDKPAELPLPPAAPVTPAATPAAPAQSSAELPQLPAAPERESEANAEAGPPTSSDTGYLPAAILQNYNLRQRRKPFRQLTDTERQNKEEQEKAALAAALAENDAATEMLEATPLAADDAEATPGAEAAAAEEPVDTETDPAAPATATDDAAAPADTAAVPDGQFLI
jgi:hypothetical protein